MNDPVYTILDEQEKWHHGNLDPGYQDTPPVDKLRACLAVGIGVRELWRMERYLVCFDVDSPDMSDIPF